MEGLGYYLTVSLEDKEKILEFIEQWREKYEPSLIVDSRSEDTIFLQGSYFIGDLIWEMKKMFGHSVRVDTEFKWGNDDWR